MASEEPLLEVQLRIPSKVSGWAILRVVASFALGLGTFCLLLSCVWTPRTQQAGQVQTEASHAVALRGQQPALLTAQDPPAGYGAPLAKRVVVAMCTNIKLHTNTADWPAWSAEMEPWWTEDMVYDFSYVGSWGFGVQRGLRAWFDGEHMHFNNALPDCQFVDFMRAATETTCTSAAYGLARWSGDLVGVPPPASKPWVNIRDIDFYLMDGNRIKVNWCMIDILDIFNQAGYHVLPPSPLQDEGYLAPTAMDGNPAPYSLRVTPELTESSMRVWQNALHEDYELGSHEARWWADTMVWYGPAGIGTARTRTDLVQHFLKPLHSAFSGLVMSTDQIVCEGNYCGAHFYLRGKHTGTWLGQEATGLQIPLRCGAHARIANGKIRESWLLIDIPLAFQAMGVDLFGRAKALAEEQARQEAGKATVLAIP